MPSHNPNDTEDHTNNDRNPKRTTRTSIPSVKRKALEDDKVATLEAENIVLRKQLGKRKRTKASSSREVPEDDGPESEDSVNEDILTNFTVGIRPMGMVTTPPALQQRHIRMVRKGSGTSPLKLSRRAFLAEPPAPQQPANEDRGLGEVARPLFDQSGGEGPAADPEPPMDRQQTHAPPPSGPPPPIPKQPKFREGYIKGNRIKAADYESPVESLLVRAAQEYEVRISTLGAFPDAQQQGQWAIDSWASACAVAGELYELTRQMNHIIKSRGSRIRGAIITKLRPSIVQHYKFIYHNTSTAVAHNLVTHTKLKQNSAYFCRDTETGDGYARHPIFLDILHQVWFDQKKAPGIIYSDYFNPIPLHTMALMFTCIEFCVNEWSTGTFIKNRFTEDDVVASYNVHVTDVKAWDQMVPMVTRRIRESYYLKSRHSAGVAPLTIPQTNITTEMAARMLAQLQNPADISDNEEVVGAGVV